MGLYRDMLDREHFRFARQCGCTHAIVHLVNYYTGSDCNIVTATDANHNYGVPSRDDPIWTAEGIRDLQALARSEGIEIYGVENFNPIDWYDILLDGPKRDEQIDIVRSITAMLAERASRRWAIISALPESGAIRKDELREAVRSAPVLIPN